MSVAGTFFGIKLCRKEARESWLWLQLLGPGETGLKREREQLAGEADELKRIFATIQAKVTPSNRCLLLLDTCYLSLAAGSAGCRSDQITYQNTPTKMALSATLKVG